MPVYRLHYFPESGNSYKLALMLTLCGERFEPVWTDFGGGITRTAQWRRTVNAMGEIPVLEVDGDAEVDEAVHDQLAIAHRGVQVREVGEGVDRLARKLAVGVFRARHPHPDGRLVGEHHGRLREQVARAQLQQLRRQCRAHAVAASLLGSRD